MVNADYVAAAPVITDEQHQLWCHAVKRLGFELIIGYHFEKFVQEALEVCPHVVFPRVAHGKDLVHVSAHQSVDGSFVLAEPLHLLACKRVSYSRLFPQRARPYLVRDGPAGLLPHVVGALSAIVGCCGKTRR